MGSLLLTAFVLGHTSHFHPHTASNCYVGYCSDGEGCGPTLQSLAAHTVWEAWFVLSEPLFALARAYCVCPGVRSGVPRRGTAGVSAESLRGILSVLLNLAGLPLQTFPVTGAKDRQRQMLVRAFAAGSRGRSWGRAEGAEYFEGRWRKRRGGAPGIHGPRAGQCPLAEKKVPGGSHGFQALETYS